MIDALFHLLFICSHRRRTFPFTPRQKAAGPVCDAQKGTYVVCLDCGRKFDYDWKRMRIRPISERRALLRENKPPGVGRVWLHPLVRLFS